MTYSQPTHSPYIALREGRGWEGVRVRDHTPLQFFLFSSVWTFGPSRWSDVHMLAPKFVSTLGIRVRVCTATKRVRNLAVLSWLDEACYDRGSSFWMKRFLIDGAP